MPEAFGGGLRISLWPTVVRGAQSCLRRRLGERGAEEEPGQQHTHTPPPGAGEPGDPAAARWAHEASPLVAQRKRDERFSRHQPQENKQKRVPTSLYRFTPREIPPFNSALSLRDSPAPGAAPGVRGAAAAGRGSRSPGPALPWPGLKRRVRPAWKERYGRVQITWGNYSLHPSCGGGGDA